MRLLATLVLGLAVAGAAGAIPTSVTSVDTAQCDVLDVPAQVQELGEGDAFPVDSRIGAIALGGIAIFPVCTTNSNGPGPDPIVTISNLTGMNFTDVWYVADPSTSISNYDGLVNGLLAFKIDAVGVHAPLVYESLAFDGIWEYGEDWDFVLQDYGTTELLPADRLGSVGVPSPGDVFSSGSIIAAAPAVPEPSTGLLLGSSLVALAIGRRRAAAPGAD